MAQATLVEMQIKEGQTLIERLAHEGITVTAAAWVKESESGDWYLYVATPLVTKEEGTRPAYHRVNAVIRDMEHEGFALEPFDKKLIGPDDPIAQDMLTNRNKRLGRTPTWFQGSRLGNLAIEEAYIYPPPPTPEEMKGSQLWECGRTELRPGIGPVGLCREVVIDLEKQAAKQKATYRGTMANPPSLQPGQVAVTWAEGGAVRIVRPVTGSTSPQRWSWSQPRGVWLEGGCPPDEVLQAIFNAMDALGIGVT